MQEDLPEDRYVSDRLEMQDRWWDKTSSERDSRGYLKVIMVKAELRSELGEKTEVERV